MNIIKQHNFHPIVREWFGQTYKRPSPPQMQGWPSIASGKNTLILAPTGSGKTLAAFLWSIDCLFRKSLDETSTNFSANPEGIHTLYISPLKALNNDIRQNLKNPLKGIRDLCVEKDMDPPEIHVAVRSGDTPSHVRQAMMRRPPHILITTPESLYLILTSEKGRALFRNLRYVIVDEIHAISNNKRGVHLSLSLERLMPLCDNEPVRIGLSATQKPLDRIARYLGGSHTAGPDGQNRERPVNIVDCGQRKKIDLKVISAVESFEGLPDDSIWQPVYEKLYKLIRSHRTTLIFANMRAQTEKIARQLNELHQKRTGDEDAEVALAHHGSISREARYEVEDRLKNGKIPAVVATASLELGIDIGSIDLVIHLEAPKSVSAGLQRVGRSGHLISATSKGRIIPLYPGDLDDCLTMARCMLDSDIEETVIPENVLDVLAQQIIAEVAMQKWDYQALFDMVRRSYCYRNLPESLFRNVLEMLNGKYSDAPVHYLKARLNWDRVNNKLIALRGARLLAAMNGGTIPDRGYYAVYLKDNNIRLGEVEEEFVNETRVGESFFLGNSEWRVDEIALDRIIVTPVAAIKPKAPFWKGDLLYREFSTSRKIGAFRGELLERIEKGPAGSWLQETCKADPAVAAQVQEYLLAQRDITEMLPTSQTVVVESCIDSGGLPLYILHATFGARVNGAWAICISAALEKHYGTQVQYSFDDDTILIRMPEVDETPPFNSILKMTAPELEALLIEGLQNAPLFSVYFRYNAARALILPRSQPSKRIPLWLQRLRAADLLQAVRTHDDFPVIIETYRDLLHDVFDLQALKTVANSISENKIRLHFVNTPYPSPMASAVVFNFVATAIYEYDQSRRPGEPARVSHELLQEILEGSEIPAMISTEQIARAEEVWQHLQDIHKARNSEDLFGIIEKMGPVSESEIDKRCNGDSGEWLAELKAEQRICRQAQFPGQWLTAEDARLYETLSAEVVLQRLKKLLMIHGPLSSARISKKLGIEAILIEPALQRMLAEKQVVSGNLIEGSDELVWCDISNFSLLYRQAVGQRRIVEKPADRSTLYRFLHEWHHLARSGQALTDIIRQYRGYGFPLYFFERALIASRFADRREQALQELNDLIAGGDVIVKCAAADDSRTQIQFFLHGEGHLFFDKEKLMQAADGLTGPAHEIFRFLQDNGASRLRELESGNALTSLEIRSALNDLTRRGLLSCDHYGAFLQVLQKQDIKTDNPKKMYGSSLPEVPWGSRRFSKRPGRSAMQKIASQRSQLNEGRWFLNSSFAVMGKPVTEKKQAEIQARLLLNRYGILVKEWYRHEQGLLPWYQIFQSLKRLEWQGEIRRGYFVEGLSGLQFALPEALDRLQKMQQEPGSRENSFSAVSTIDPLLPFGRAVKWDLSDSQNNALGVVRNAANFIVFENEKPLVYLENYGFRLWLLDDLKEMQVQLLCNVFKDWLGLPDPIRPRKNITIGQINSADAAGSDLADLLKANGFETDGQAMVLWPSAI